MTAEDKKPPPPLKYKDLINVSSETIQRKYRVTHMHLDLGWVDINLESSLDGEMLL